MELRITEIFLSLQGETRTVGLPTVFIRLTGCPLRCGYCDTAYAFKGGKKMSLDDIMNEVRKYKAHYVTVTGGEPLAQKNALPLMTKLCDEGYEVSIETSGALDVSEVDPRVVKVVDLKTPGSKECSKNLYENIAHLNKKDHVKFVICNREDYDWSVDIMQQYDLSSKCEVLFSPSYNDISGSTLADWIVYDQLPVRFQIQLHKILWQDQPGK
ncbi:MAG: 7-carboxy-7-deazaguanine synthase [Gammaproteobacteria bacterium]|jgi:7-carboxy-7-deazaguanine synthase|nr:7-carboxy-7-deazaguanine synthase [Gammaproteobacteria bacterium]